MGPKLPYTRYAALIKQMGRFVSVGAVNTVLTFVLYQVLLLVMPYWLAYTVSFPVGIAIAAIGNSRFVFGADLSVVGAIRFSAFYLISFVLGIGLLAFLVRDVGVPAALAPFIVVPVMLPINFLCSRMALVERKSMLPFQSLDIFRRRT